jgi:DNA polymerase (family 10)
VHTVKNALIARIFEDIANLLEVKGENPFKIRAYRKAALNIEGLARDIEEIARAGELQTIPGIGKDLAQKVTEYVETGKIGDFETLTREVPESLLEVLGVPSMGPKKVKFLFEEKGVKSLEDLEKLAKAGALKDLPGFGAKTEENILKGIAVLRGGKERTPLGIAVNIARDIIEHLKELPSVKRIEYTGSLRRCRETVRDIDILITSTSPGKVMEKFVALPHVGDILAKGETKASVRTREGIQVDLRVVEPECFGAALQYFTGSQAHNIRLRDMASRRGLKINEYGVFREKDDKKLGGGEEEDIYRVLGLPYIPPEIREDRGEVEAAMKGELPDLVELADIKGDLHLHTKLSDGFHTLPEIVEYAKGLGYRYIAVTEHSKSLKIARGIDEKRLMEQISEIRDFNRGLKGFRVLSGIEVDILQDGSLDLSDAVLSECDVVVASVHSAFKQPREKMTERIVRAMESPHVDIIAHPTGRLIGARDAYEVDVEALIGAARRTGTALEINAYPKRLDLNDRHARMAKEAGVRIAVNTDMHTLEEFHHMRLGVSVARRAWCTRSDLLNTMDADDLLKQLGKGKNVENPLSTKRETSVHSAGVKTRQAAGPYKKKERV